MQNAETTENTTPQTPTQTPPPEPKGTPGNEGEEFEAGVRLQTKDYDELRSQAERAKELEERLRETDQRARDYQILTTSEVTDPRFQESYIRLAMSNGRSEQEARAALEEAMNESGADDTPQTPQTSKTPQNDAPATSAEKEELKRLREQMEGITRQQAEAQKQRVRELFNNRLESAVGSDDFMKKLREAKGDEAAKGFREEIEEAARYELEKIYRQAQAKSGGSAGWDDSWIDQAVQQAKDRKIERYRSVIGDPNKLGRTPETVTELEALAKKEVGDGNWVPGKGIADIQMEQQDLLAKELAEDLIGGGTNL